MASRKVLFRQAVALLFFALSSCIGAQPTSRKTELIPFPKGAAVDDPSGGVTALRKSSPQLVEHIGSANAADAEKELQLRAEGNGVLKLDRALCFDGKDDFVHIQDFQGLPRHQITVAAWVKIRRHRNWNRIVSHNWITNGWNLFTDGSGVAHFGIGLQNKDYASARITHRDRWHYLVGTYDGAAVRVFVDGEEGVNAPLEGAELDDRGSVFIGGGEWDPFNGDISEMRIWNYAQNPDEIRRNMFSTPDLNNKSLVALYDFSEFDSGAVLDKSQFRSHGVLGAEHRAPVQVVSNAPIVTPCVVHSKGAPGVLTQLHELGLRRIRSVKVVRRGGERSAELGARQDHVSEKRYSNEEFERLAQGKSDEKEIVWKEPLESQESGGFTREAKRDRSEECHEETTCKSDDNFTQAEAATHSERDLVTSAEVLDFDNAPVPACLEVLLEDDVDVADADSETDGGSRVVHVDVLGSEEQCGARPLHRDSCWGVRTELHFMRPAKTPLPGKLSLSEHAANRGGATSSPRVSVVIPVYNAGKDLPEAVESVVSQTFEDWEIILVNDGSTDDSADVISQLEQRLAPAHRVRVVTKANGGLADARNAGVHVAAGEWILPLDADDMIEKTFLEKAFSVIEANRTVNLVIADFRGFGDWEYVWGIPPFSAEDLPYTNMFHCSGMFKKSLWAAAGGYPTSTLLGYEDWAFWIAANLATPLAPHRIEEDLFLARMRRGSMHRKLMWYQAFSVASMRIRFPGLYTVEMLLDAHAVFFDAPAHIAREVERKVAQFPQLPQPRLMRGLIREGKLRRAGLKESNEYKDVLEDYRAAVGLASREDWQPKWRLGLLQKRLGMREEGERMIELLERDFVGLNAALRHTRVAVT
ncbi:hypothetical protein KFL_000040480 [Klebsormidium nitens]|uniref:Glycosyltransferase 2-like domain-containing protein n=1 Tax=Klebsormidium nitens TaxID=105231 RepID=A0A1Y1HPU6_KLENI|nr:hypothetical protein KFL_000040480 [Klebsormidium nitens]|eukprot:GAQ77848.1 hypothetical protein KFL_000040480 [Klebsormidium nitens]